MIRRALTGLAFLALLAVPGCSDPLGAASSDLARALERWSDANVTTYEFTVQRSCFCAEIRPLRVTVDHDTVVSVAFADTNLAVDTTYRRDLLTIDRIFALIRRTLDDDPATVNAEYHPQLGYPVSFNVDPDIHTADEEFSLAISELNIIVTSAAVSAASRPGDAPRRRHH